MSGEASEISRRYRKAGAVWPRGRDLDDARARPSITASGGNVLITPGPTGTDLSVRQPAYVSAAYDSVTQLVTVSFDMFMWVGSSLSRVRDVFVFDLPPTIQDIQFWWVPVYRWSLPTEDTPCALMWYAMPTGGVLGAFGTPDYVDTDVTHAGTAAAWLPCYGQALGFGGCACVAHLGLKPDGTLLYLGQPVYYSETGPQWDMGYLVGEVPGGRELAHGPQSAEPPPLLYYSQDDAYLHWLYPGPWAVGGSSYMSLDIPPSTSGGLVEAKALNGSQWSGTAVLDEVHADGSWYQPLAVISTDAAARLTSLFYYLPRVERELLGPRSSQAAVITVSGTNYQFINGLLCSVY